MFDEELSNDIHDVESLWRLELVIQEATKKVNAAIQNNSELELILYSYLADYQIKPTLSPKNKFIELRRLGEAPVRKMVDDYFKSCTEVTTLKNHLKQVEGMRDSKKKIMSIAPR